MYMILDGQIDISFDLLDRNVTEAHLKEIAKDLDIPFRLLHRDIDIYKTENGLTQKDVAVKAIRQELA